MKDSSSPILSNFYKAASSVWSDLTNPTLDEVQLAMLEIVAKTINYNLKLERDTFGQALFDILLVLINRNNEIITEENFIRLMKNYLGILWKEELNYYHACSEYYEFVKHFILIDFPNRQHNLLKRFNVALQSKICYFNDNMITLIEEVWKDLYERFLKSQFQLKKKEGKMSIPRTEEENIIFDENAKKEILHHQLTHILISNSNYNRCLVIGVKMREVLEEIGEYFFIGLNQNLMEVKIIRGVNLQFKNTVKMIGINQKELMEVKMIKNINVQLRNIVKIIKIQNELFWVRISWLNEKMVVLMENGKGQLKKRFYVINLSYLNEEIEKIFVGIRKEKNEMSNKSLELYEKILMSYQGEKERK